MCVKKVNMYGEYPKKWLALLVALRKLIFVIKNANAKIIFWQFLQTAKIKGQRQGLLNATLRALRNAGCVHVRK